MYPLRSLSRLLRALALVVALSALALAQQPPGAPGKPVVDAPAADTVAPVIAITSPNSTGSSSTSSTTVSVSGTLTDEGRGVASSAWTSSIGGSGACSVGTGTFSCTGIPYTQTEGATTTVSVTGTDLVGNVSAAATHVFTYTTGGGGGGIDAYFTGTTRNAASCSRADVGTAVSASSNTDIVTIPAGDCTWATQLTVPVGIKLQGAGQGSTILRDNVTKDGSSNSSLIQFTANSPTKWRVTGFTMIGQAADTNVFNKGHISAFTSSEFRLDHITFQSTQTSAIRLDNCPIGVIDNITVTGNRLGIQLGAGTCGGSNYGDYNWAQPLTLGSSNAIFIEDSTFTASGDPFVTNALDGLDGVNVVFRHNTLTQANTTAHGTDSGQRRRSIRSQEIYNNTYSFPSGMAADFIAWFRGGTGVMWGNAVTIPGGLNHMAKKRNERDYAAFTPWGKCDGTGPYDGNSNSSGYRCVDQPGAGTSANLGGNATPIATANILDPIYVWNNTVGGSSNNCGTWGCSSDGNVVVDRDMYLGTARPGYTPYTYPHPLRGGS